MRNATRLLLLSVSLAISMRLGASGAEVARYGIGSWPEKGRGNHRAVLRVEHECDAAWTHIPWRRRDREPASKGVLIFDAATGKRVTNVVRVNISRESGDLVFQPATVPGDYHVYYLPYNPPGTGPFGTGFGPPGGYFRPEDTADAAWVARQGLKEGKWRGLPPAKLVEIQARREFDRVDPMEVIATKQEVDELLVRHAESSYLIFPEDRRYPIRMFEDLPYRWVERGPSDVFRGEARPGEFYVFQIGVWACRKAIENLRLEFSDLTSSGGRTIPSSELRCFNLNGSDWLGRPLEKTFSVGRGLVRPLWVGVKTPRDATGRYTGTVRVCPRSFQASMIRIELRVSGPVLADAGDSDTWRLSRLRWLDSKLGLDDGVVAPYTPLEADGQTVRCLGRQVEFGSCGFPAGIVSNSRPVLADPVRLVVETEAGPQDWAPTTSRVTKVTPGVVERETHARSKLVALTVRSKMELDGCLAYRATLRASRICKATDIRLEVPIVRGVAKYLMGMRRRGGFRPKEWQWKWDINRADNMVWVGDADAGLQLKLMWPTDTWQLRNLKDTGLPDSWANSGNGGCSIVEEGDAVVVRAYSGPRVLSAGEEIEFRSRFLITPFRPIDPNHWNWRYGNIKADANIQHVHHGPAANPHINYPFLTAPKLKQLVSDVQSIRFKETDFGSLTYPAKGHIDLDKGALHVWVRINFDPQAGQPRQAQYNQSLFALDFPNEDQLCLYWNIDDRGLRTYVRKGPPEKNQYRILFGSRQAGWRKGQKHLLTLSWGNELAIFVDGKRAVARRLLGTLRNSLDAATLRFRGRGFGIDAIKIADAPFRGGSNAVPTADDHTLLLDTFAAWDGGDTTRPEKCAPDGPGRIDGIAEKKAGDHGPEIVFSSRRVATPPKGVNLYYTVRELSNHVAEMWALRSLGDEVFTTAGVDVYADPRAASQSGGGYPWLREHLVAGYKPRWRTVLGSGAVDAAIGMQGLSRWHNYYVEGMAWLMRTTGLDGLYLDGIGYDREIMKRIAKVMYRTNPRSRINFHAGDGWDPPWDQGRNISAANLYLEHFPYISNLWFGELFDYRGPPDYWLVEVSGVPFGLTGEMLHYHNGGNPYRGMIYGMCGRMHASKTGLWRFWDKFGIQGAEMIGYWDRHCPVRTDRESVLATVYRKAHQSLIALAHWPQKLRRLRASVRAAAKPPTIDGHIAPGEWDAAARLTNFTLLSGEQVADKQTTAFVTYDRERLFFAFRCQHAQSKPRADAASRDGRVWEDDAIELFIQPSLDSRTYFQFVGNSASVLADSRGRDAKWNGQWTYKASVQAGHWQGEVSIPFASLGMPAPHEGQVIGLNICRDQQTPRVQLSCWSPMSQTFHDPGRFGRLVLSQTKPPTREKPSKGRGQQTINVRLVIDWPALGLDKKRCTLVAPALSHFQPAAQFAPDAPIPIGRARGWLLVVGER